MYQRSPKAPTSGLTPNQMRESIHTAPGSVEGLVPMGASLNQKTTLYPLSASPRHELSNRLKDALRLGENVVGVEHDGSQYAVQCTEIREGGVDGLKTDVERAHRARAAGQTVLGVEQDGKRYRVEITPLHRALQTGKGRRGRGRPKGSKNRRTLRKGQPQQ
jgi:hemin uptake protein HemP